MFTMKILNTAILISLLLSGCATGSKDSILPQDGPTMKQVYEGHFNGERLNQNKAEDTENKVSNNNGVSTQSKKLISHRHDNETDLSGYTRTAHNEIQQIFPRLRNKTLTLYIFPHLSKGERHPVPGYSTAFTLYKQVEYALPGELAEGY